MGQEKKVSTPKYKHLAPGKIRKVLLPLNGTRWLQRKGNKIRTWRDVFHLCVLPVFIFRRHGLCRNTEKSRRDSFLTETYINIYLWHICIWYKYFKVSQERDCWFTGRECGSWDGGKELEVDFSLFNILYTSCVRSPTKELKFAK